MINTNLVVLIKNIFFCVVTSVNSVTLAENLEI